jgi:GTP diphosphokinase / guanosine-3',5'-bis(diphosphate) 3'-diphosphatase
VRTRDMHEEAEYGIAAHWIYKKGKGGKADEEWLSWVRSLLDWQQDEADPREFMKTFRTDLFDDEVYVFTPKGEVKTLPAGATPIDFAYAVHTDVGHKTVGAKINGRIVPLHYRLKNGDFVEILTSKSGRGPSRDWMSLAASSKARNKIRQWFQRETRGETEAKGRELLDNALKAQSLPYRKLQGSAVLAQVIRETGFKKAEDFYVALGAGKLQSGQIVNKVLQRLKTEEVAEEPVVPLKAPRSRSTVAGDTLGIRVTGVEDVLVRMAKCCTPVPGDPILGYISFGRGITIHREDCPNVKALKRNPERFTPVEWDGGATTTSFRVQIAVDSFDRPRLLEDVARSFAEHGANIVSYGGVVEDGMARNWYTAEVGDVKELRTLLGVLRNLEGVFDAYRMTPS